mmetsp:Transcript_16492/g.40623  ORF Transcript_16492/g.40623 Transcript_16492/m.40623 type:complete len:175 (-) Transcript_16492:168-692(-)|eukprot:CAMPEP_0114523108 /NCGR_PEP_ID=MMETSP0109-20121206/21111_1 /TAXON_ID=29199 /ORGANISM="Chlorarachnion reptans, Strain CCCM449" /LENGTH=174 /DNA_ID=CAMNT_0001704393 /DNA_START=138 /DNA_END=662 /DNA_ORIENTATION=-
MAEEPAQKKFKKGVEFSAASLDGKDLRIGIVKARWNAKITNSLVDGCKKSLTEAKVKDIVVIEVAGSFELPFAAKKMIDTGKFAAVICIGCLIKGETMHFEYICESVSRGIMDLGLKSGIPVIFGVLTCLNETQALVRAGLENETGKMHNHGKDWGFTAVEMACLERTISGSIK